MKIVRIKNNVVIEIIPNYALPVEYFYGLEFAAQCVEAPDEVDQRWILNEDGTWTDPDTIPDEEPEIQPTAEERIAALEQENNLLTQQVEALSGQIDFQEECLVEMASIVYA